VATVLNRYLSKRLQSSSLTFQKLPEEYPDGWETHTYSFHLRSSGRLPRSFGGPLIARIYLDRQGIARARHECAVMRHMRQLRFPVTEPLLLEEKCHYFGGPFFLRTEACGETLLRVMLRRPRKLWMAAGSMAALQARLHQLPAHGFPVPAEPLLARSLQELAEDIRAAGWKGLLPGLNWLVSHRPDPPSDPRILHLDFHPMNLIQQADGSVVPIDWPESDIGDPHADVATSLVLTECTPAKNTGPLDRVSVWVGRAWFVRWYLRTYRRRMGLDESTLVYYRAWAALRRLCRYGKWLNANGISGVCKPSAVARIHPADWRILETYFEKWTGIRVRL
jgi:aminoglycoside phosphotransferase (APT) family kinase protein